MKPGFCPRFQHLWLTMQISDVIWLLISTPANNESPQIIIIIMITVTWSRLSPQTTLTHYSTSRSVCLTVLNVGMEESVYSTVKGESANSESFPRRTLVWAAGAGVLVGVVLTAVAVFVFSASSHDSPPGGPCSEYRVSSWPGGRGSSLSISSLAMFVCATSACILVRYTVTIYKPIASC